MFFKPIVTDHFKEVSRKKGWKGIFYRHYIITEEISFFTGILGKEFEIKRKSDGLLLAKLEKNGLLTVYPGYYWDGPSGPTIDSIAFVYGSIPHDILYQALRENLLIQPEFYQYCFCSFEDDFEHYRKLADDCMKKINKDYGMKNPRLYYTWKAVRMRGAEHARPQELTDWLEAG